MRVSVNLDVGVGDADLSGPPQAPEVDTHTLGHPLNVAMVTGLIPARVSSQAAGAGTTPPRYSVDGIPVQPGRTEGSVPALSSLSWAVGQVKWGGVGRGKR